MDRQPLIYLVRSFCCFAGTLPSVAIMIIGTKGFAEVGVGWANAQVWISILIGIGVFVWLAAVLIPAMMVEKGPWAYVTVSAASLGSTVGVGFSIFAALQTP